MKKDSKTKVISYAAITILLCSLAVFFIGLRAMSVLNNVTFNLTEVVGRLDELERHLDLANAELSKTINTLNSDDVIDNDLKIKAHKFVMLQLIKEISLKIQKGYDALASIELLSQYVGDDSKIIISDLQRYYSSQVPGDNFFITAINNLIEEQGTQYTEDKSKTSKILDRLVKINDIQDKDDYINLSLALNSMKSSNVDQALSYLSKLSSKCSVI